MKHNHVCNRFTCLLTQTANQLNTWQQLNALGLVDKVKTTCRSWKQHQKWEEQGVGGLWTWRTLLVPDATRCRSENFTSCCWSTGIFTHNNLCSNIQDARMKRLQQRGEVFHFHRRHRRRWNSSTSLQNSWLDLEMYNMLVGCTYNYT